MCATSPPLVSSCTEVKESSSSGSLSCTVNAVDVVSAGRTEPMIASSAPKASTVLTSWVEYTLRSRIALYSPSGECSSVQMPVIDSSEVTQLSECSSPLNTGPRCHPVSSASWYCSYWFSSLTSMSSIRSSTTGSRPLNSKKLPLFEGFGWLNCAIASGSSLSRAKNVYMSYFRSPVPNSFG